MPLSSLWVAASKIGLLTGIIWVLVTKALVGKLLKTSKDSSAYDKVEKLS